MSIVVTLTPELEAKLREKADQAFLWISQVTSPEKARQWYQGLLKSMLILSLYYN